MQFPLSSPDCLFNSRLAIRPVFGGQILRELMMMPVSRAHMTGIRDGLDAVGTCIHDFQLVEIRLLILLRE